MTDPFNLVMERVESPTVAICNGKRTILLGTYNYMGMTFDPDVIAAGKKALDEFGSGTTGSRVLNGTYSGHRACEEALKDFYAMDHAMVFSTGYQANLGDHFDPGRQGRLHHPRHRQPRVDLRRLRARQRPDRAVPPQRHRGDGKAAEAGPRGRRQAGRAGGRLFDARRCRAAQGDGPRGEGKRRHGAGRRGAFDGLHRRQMAAASPRPRA